MGVIEESNSSWNSPVSLVVKGTKNRLCLDARKVNERTIKDAYPLPHIDGILSRLQNTRFISAVDLKDAFWQIPLEKKSREKQLSLCLVDLCTNLPSCRSGCVMRHNVCVGSWTKLFPLVYVSPCLCT